MVDEKKREEYIKQEIKDFKSWWNINGKIRPIKIDVKECRKGALRRHQSFNGKNSKRVFSDKVKEEFIGYCGEVAFEKLTGYPMNKELGPDNGIDFILPDPIGPINVKCTERWLNLLIKKKDPCLKTTNIVVSSYFIQQDEKYGNVYFVGVTNTKNIGSLRNGWENEYFESTNTNNFKKPLINLSSMDKFIKIMECAEKKYDNIPKRKQMFKRNIFF
jgi:hypothetical protein